MTEPNETTPSEKEPKKEHPELRKAFAALLHLLRRPVVLVGAVLVILAGALFFSANQIMSALLHGRAEVTVPNLEGKSLTESLGLVSGLNLSLRQEGFESDESIPAGTILRQHPPSGMKVREGRAISVVISKGGQAVFVPVMIGKPVPEIQSILAQEKLQLGAVSEMYSSEIPEGLCVSQTPSSGTVVARNAMVDVVLSKGLPPAGAPIVPDFTGKSVDAAQTWAKDVNVAISVNENPSSVGAPGTVVKQEPLAGQPLLEGDSLRVTIVPVVETKGGMRFTYQVPADKGEVSVRMVARTGAGESEIYRGLHKGGETVGIPVTVSEATTRVRIYLNDELAEEKILEP